MTKLHTFIGAALLSITFNAQAGDCPALSGQYSIGTDDADFSTVSEAVNALKCGGVSGPVTFQIADGTYNEKVTLSSISALAHSIQLLSNLNLATTLVLSLPILLAMLPWY